MKNFLLLCLYIMVVASACAQDTKILKLRKEQTNFTPKNFHIAYVKDDRTDITNIGMVKVGVFNKLVYAQLEGGAARSISSFLTEEMSQSNTTTPISLHITRMKVEEKNVTLHEQADLDMSVAFYYKDVKAIEYKGTAYHQTGIDATHYNEEMVRENLVSCMKQFDDWWADNKTMYMAAADGNKTKTAGETLEVNVKMDTVADDSDKIEYSKKRPLSFADYDATPDDLSLGAAATYTSINMGYRSDNNSGKWKVEVAVSVYMDKSQSWARTKNKVLLAHEQLHFDISALKACELTNAIKAGNYTLNDFEAKLKELHKKYSTENNQMQNDYDKETKHSTITAQQAKWEKKINEALAKTTCY